MADGVSQKPRRLWRVIFALSLALNLAVIGIVAGLGLRDMGRGQAPRGFDMALGPVGRALEPADRRAIGDALRDNPALRGDGRAETRQLTQDLVTVLRATPFERDDLADVVATASARADRIQAAARDALIARIAGMSDAERAALADRIAERNGRGG